MKLTRRDIRESVPLQVNFDMGEKPQPTRDEVLYSGEYVVKSAQNVDGPVWRATGDEEVPEALIRWFLSQGSWPLFYPEPHQAGVTWWPPN